MPLYPNIFFVFLLLTFGQLHYFIPFWWLLWRLYFVDFTAGHKKSTRHLRLINIFYVGVLITNEFHWFTIQYLLTCCPSMFISFCFLRCFRATNYGETACRPMLKYTRKDSPVTLLYIIYVCTCCVSSSVYWFEGQGQQNFGAKKLELG